MPKQCPQPAFLDTARAFFAERSEMDEDKQSFAVAHLRYLNLQAQAAGQRIVTQVRDLLDEEAESLTTAIGARLPDEAEEDEWPDDDRDPDGFPVDAEREDGEDDPAVGDEPEATDGDDAEREVA